MSVVNKMLKDLEQRDKQPVYEADYVPVESKSAKSRKLVVGIFVLIVALALATWFLLPGEDASSNSVQRQLTASSATNEQTPKNLIILPPNAAQKIDASDMLLEDLPARLARQAGFSELDETSLVSLDSAKKAEQAAKAAEAKLAAVERELAQVKTTLDEQSNAMVNAAQINKAAQENTAIQINRTALADSMRPTNSPKPADNIARTTNTAAVDETDSMLVDSKQTPQAETEPSAFSVSSSSKGATGNGMLEQRIQLSLKNGDTAAALKDLNSLLALEPRNTSARKRLASLEFAQGNPKRAAFLLDQGIKLAPSDSSIRLMQARLLFRENRNEQALALLNEHPINVIADNDLLSFRAALAEKQKQYARSLEDYAVLLKRQPNNARWMLGLAISQDKQKMHEQAVLTYREVKSSNQLSAQVVSFVDGRLAALAGS